MESTAPRLLVSEEQRLVPERWARAHGTPQSVTMRACIVPHSEGPKPFVWAASVEAILEKVGRCEAVLETAQ